jgi:hypothetical protein
VTDTWSERSEMYRTSDAHREGHDRVRELVAHRTSGEVVTLDRIAILAVSC